MNNNIKLIFADGTTEMDVGYSAGSGKCTFITAELPNGKQYPLEIYDVYTLGQHTENNLLITKNTKYLAFSNLVVVPDISIENIKYAVEGLYSDGAFNYFLPKS